MSIFVSSILVLFKRVKRIEFLARNLYKLFPCFLQVFIVFKVEFLIFIDIKWEDWLDLLWLWETLHRFLWICRIFSDPSFVALLRITTVRLPNKFGCKFNFLSFFLIDVESDCTLIFLYLVSSSDHCKVNSIGNDRSVCWKS